LPTALLLSGCKLASGANREPATTGPGQRRDGDTGNGAARGLCDRHREIIRHQPGEIAIAKRTTPRKLCGVNQGDLPFEIDRPPCQRLCNQAEAALEKITRSGSKPRRIKSGPQYRQSKNAQSDAVRYDALAKQGVVSRTRSKQFRTAPAVRQPVAARCSWAPRFWSINCISGLQRKRRDLDVELAAARAGHLIGAAHHTRRGLQRAP
jgi:hypothetical protein